MVEIWRWPKASYSASSMALTLTPRREAVSRSMLKYTCRPRFCRSLATSISSGWSLSASVSLGVHSSSRAASGDSRLNWNWVRLTRSSMVRSCTGWRNSWMPATLASSGRRRSITALAVTSRSAWGLRLISRRPLLRVALSPSTPM